MLYNKKIGLLTTIFTISVLSNIVLMVQLVQLSFSPVIESKKPVVPSLIIEYNNDKIDSTYVYKHKLK